MATKNEAEVSRLQALLKGQPKERAEADAAVVALARLHAEAGQEERLRALIRDDVQAYFQTVPKAHTARVVRQMIRAVAEVGEGPLLAALCKECIAWCVREQRTFLKLRIASRLASVLTDLFEYKEALALINRTVREVKKIDDKLLLVEIHLTEAKVLHRLRNIPKSKAALTSGRAAANAIYCPPELQARIDRMAGVLCSEEHDFKTAFSYFFEAFEGFNTIKMRAEAMACLKYMLLAKVMSGQTQDVYSIINGRAGVEYGGREVEAMRAIADAKKERSLHSYSKLYEEFKAELVDDLIVFNHLQELYETLLEQNLLRIVEPYDRVQVARVAEIIDLSQNIVEPKLSQMILDRKLNGILDQGAGDLIMFDGVEEDSTYKAALETIGELNAVVDKLYERAKLVR